ncbi:MAG: T9SS type A sorting domain-containing protein, partial [Candidatus Nitrosocosmicus sp.]|nr:T9SS type A sorting domain-containing protein [Candidatus Nitrosocosmicus sp.]
IYVTYNGGGNWIQQYRDSVGIFVPTNIKAVDFNNVWAGNDFWNIIHASSNGGNIWGRQSSPIFRPAIIEMADSLNGWVGLNNLCHTTDGGGLITYIGIDPVNTEVPDKYILKQNYPNPFNPQTTIEFSIKQNSNVSLRLYDILGKEIIRIYDNENLQAGNYKAVLDFSKKDLSSGTYFYTLTVNDGHSGHLFRDTKKLMYLK